MSVSDSLIEGSALCCCEIIIVLSRCKGVASTKQNDSQARFYHIRIWRGWRNEKEFRRCLEARMGKALWPLAERAFFWTCSSPKCPHICPAGLISSMLWKLFWGFFLLSWRQNIILIKAENCPVPHNAGWHAPIQVWGFYFIMVLRLPLCFWSGLWWLHKSRAFSYGVLLSQPN